MTKLPCVALAALVPLLGGCLAVKPSIVYEDFEDDACDGAPCGWSSAAGRPPVRWIETLPGLRGLELREGSVARFSGTYATRMITSPYGSTGTAELLVGVAAVCTSGSRLAIELEIVTQAGVATANVDVTPASTWDVGVAPYQRVTSTNSGTARTFESLSIAIVGNGICVVDDIDITSRAHLDG